MGAGRYGAQEVSTWGGSSQEKRLEVPGKTRSLLPALFYGRRIQGKRLQGKQSPLLKPHWVLKTVNTNQCKNFMFFISCFLSPDGAMSDFPRAKFGRKDMKLLC